MKNTIKKIWNKIQNIIKITVTGFKSLYYTHFSSKNIKEEVFKVMTHGNKKYIVFEYPIISGGKVYTSIQELYDENKAKKENKSKLDGNKRKSSRKVSKEV